MRDLILQLSKSSIYSTKPNRSTWAPRFNIQGKHNTAMYLYCFYYSGDFNKGTFSRSVIF
ncbi:hypothetical protein DXM10_00830 [Shigella sonnei]|nr:hypothetical protein [Shigella sonnei]